MSSTTQFPPHSNPWRLLFYCKGFFFRFEWISASHRQGGMIKTCLETKSSAKLVFSHKRLQLSFGRIERFIPERWKCSKKVLLRDASKKHDKKFFEIQTLWHISFSTSSCSSSAVWFFFGAVVLFLFETKPTAHALTHTPFKFFQPLFLIH